VAEQLSFLTPVTYGNAAKTSKQSALELVDDYFYLGGRKAQVLQGVTKDGVEIAMLTDVPTSMVRTAIKVLTYLTIVLPAVLLFVKALLRMTHNIELITAGEHLEKSIDITNQSVEEVVKGMAKDVQFKERLESHDYTYCHGQEKLVKECYEDMVKATEAILLNNLNLLRLPQAKLFGKEYQGQKYYVIIRQRLYTESTALVSTPTSDKAKEQLKRFREITGFKDAKLNEDLLDPSRHGVQDKEQPQRVLDLGKKYV
jgi:hypothetical protein